jgi:hypothetical protein
MDITSPQGQEENLGDAGEGHQPEPSPLNPINSPTQNSARDEGPSPLPKIRTELGPSENQQRPTQDDPSSSNPANNVASTSRRRGRLIQFYGVDLTGCPMEALFSIIPEGCISRLGRTTLEKYAEVVVHSQLSVWFHFLLFSLTFARLLWLTLSLIF